MLSSVALRERRRDRQRFKMRANTKPRLVVYRSNKNIYAQIVEAKTGNILFSASTISKSERDLTKKSWNVDAASKIGKAIADKAIAKGVTEVVFDRSGFLYHGRIKALADSARASGLKF